MTSDRYGIVGRVVAGLLLLALIGLPQHGVSAGSIRYAKPGGLNSGSCSTWATACKLQRAITVAVSGDQVWVAKGGYKPTPTTDRTKSFRLKNGVAIYGGFTGTETLLIQRNWGGNATVLTGDIGSTGVLTDNSYHVVIGSSSTSPTNSTAVLDGFYITAGYANADLLDAYGAGILNQSGSPTLRNLFIEANGVVAGTNDAAGAGIANISSNPTLNNVVMFGNVAQATGTGIAAGGGMYNAGSSPTLTKVAFSVNQAFNGAGMYNASGSMPTITNSTFVSNTATSLGGGIYSSNSSPLLRLTNVTFESNSAHWGAGMYNDTSSPALNNVTFYGNTAASSGGGIYNYLSSPTLTNATLSGNTASTGGGMANYSSIPYIDNSIFWGDGSTEIVDDPYSISTIANSIVQGGCPSGSTCNPANVYNVDPALGPLQDNGGLVKTMALGVYSAALDWGDAATCTTRDARGLRRPQGIRCDIGAYEVRTKTFISQAANDGWVLESSAGSGLGGGTPNTTATTLRLGDNALNRQYRAVLSFDTAGVPDGASVISAYLMVKKAGMVGDTSPLTWIRLDEVNPYFGSGPGLVRTDFQAPEDSYPNDLTEFTIDWYAAGPLFALAPDGGINKTGTTQFRPRFNTATDNDFAADYLTFYSGNALVASDRPKLIVYYNP